MIKLSFIIPFYNGEKYIDECLSSIYNQDVPLSDFEVIVVDDHSSDQKSVKKITEYHIKYSNLFIIHNETNQRCGMCRNIGLQNAKGRYVWFIDQDDYIKLSCLNEILHLCETNDLDMLYFDYSNVNDDLTLNKKMNIVTNDSSILTGLDYIQTICKGDFWHSEYDTNVWHAVFKRDFMISNNVFSPPVSYCEDLIVVQHAIIVAKRFQSVKKDYYCYRYNSTSVFNTQVGKQGRLIFDATIYTGAMLIKLSSIINQKKYCNEKWTVFQGGVSRLNSFTKQLFKISSNERKLFYEYATANLSLITANLTYLRKINIWILDHPVVCQKIPYIVYLWVKLMVK